MRCISLGGRRASRFETTPQKAKSARNRMRCTSRILAGERGFQMRCSFTNSVRCSKVGEGEEAERETEPLLFFLSFRTICHCSSMVGFLLLFLRSQPRSETVMSTLVCCRVLMVGVAMTLSLATQPLRAQPGSSAAVAIDGDDIGGVVRGQSGPEAGVWVIAETPEKPPVSPDRGDRRPGPLRHS